MFGKSLFTGSGARRDWCFHYVSGSCLPVPPGSTASVKCRHREQASYAKVVRTMFVAHSPILSQTVSFGWS